MPNKELNKPDSYQGQWKDGKIHGFGKYKSVRRKKVKHGCSRTHTLRPRSVCVGTLAERCTRAASAMGNATATACRAPVGWPRCPPAFSLATGSTTRRRDTASMMTSPGAGNSRKDCFVAVFLISGSSYLERY